MKKNDKRASKVLDRKTIARQNIFAWLELHQISQAELARRMDITPRYLWRVLRSDRSLGPKMELRLVAAMNLRSISEIYKHPQDNPMIDRLIDKQASLIGRNGNEAKLHIIEKLVDLLNVADKDTLEHISRQIDLLKKLHP